SASPVADNINELHWAASVQHLPRWLCPVCVGKKRHGIGGDEAVTLQELEEFLLFSRGLFGRDALLDLPEAFENIIQGLFASYVRCQSSARQGDKGDHRCYQ